MPKAKPGDKVLVDAKEAARYDSKFGALLLYPEVAGETIEMGIYDYEFEGMEPPASYIVLPVGTNTADEQYQYHIEERHIIENLSEKFCEKHLTDGYYSDKYEMQFCPFCKIDWKTRVHRHPLFRKIFYPYGDDDDIPRLDEEDFIIEIPLHIFPLLGILGTIASAKYMMGEDSSNRHKNRLFLFATIGVMSHIIYVTIALAIIGTYLL